ncbi:MAG: hypothetical protein LUF90_08185 [Rikenellaceae bacterium]|nr:hypothetical protein [Rikenellaceae bacterium]
MKKLLVSIICIFLAFSCFAFQSQVATYILSDGEEVTGRLCVPVDNVFITVVFAIHKTGPHPSQSEKREINFNFHEDLANEFCSRGVAFFTYDRWGVTVEENGNLLFLQKETHLSIPNILRIVKLRM